jgi:Ca2+-binding RTX toxin-like protein
MDRSWFFNDANNSTTSYTLTSGADSITTTSGRAIVTATSGTLSSGDVISLNGHHNTLVLSGAGTFDLTAPTTLSGVDRVTGDATAAQTITLSSASLYLSAGDGNDTVTSLTGNDTIKLGNGNDTVSLGSGNTLLALGNGNDTVTLGSGAASIGLGSGTNTIHGSTGELHVFASSGTDTVTAGGGDTYVVAGSGADTITGSTGKLAVVAGAGTTTLTFGSGTGVLGLVNKSGSVTVNSFAHGTDTIDLSHLGITSWAQLQSAATIGSDGSGGTKIVFSNGPTIDLVGIASVTTADFSYAHGHSFHPGW